MRVPQVQIQTTQAQIALTIQQPQQHIEQLPADMKIRQQDADLSVKITPGQLQIDSTQLRADLGLYTFDAFARNAAQKGQQDVLAGIARRAREGEQLGDIASGGKPLVSIAKSRNDNMQQKQTGIAFIPSYNSVKLDYTPANVDINVQVNKPNITVNINKPVHQYTPGKTTVDLIQKPSIQIDWKL